MRIEHVDVFQRDLEYAGGVYELSGGRTYRSFDATLVRVTTDTGVIGWGESTPFGPNYVAAHARGVRAGIEEIAPHILGLDPRRVDRVAERMDLCLAGHPHAKTPIDVACWDVFGRSVGMPVCELLGGSTQARLPVISSIPTDEPPAMRANVEAHRAAGYRGHSVKIGAAEHDGGPTLDAERVAASLADARPGEYFIVDANGGMTVESALRFLRLLPDGLDFVFEAPCATWAETVRLARRTDVPLIIDELALTDAAIIDMVASGVGDGVGLKVSKNGGLTAGRRHRDLCLAAGFTMSVQDTVGSEVSFAAVVHLAQSVPTRALRCVLDVRGMVSTRLGQIDVEIEEGGVVAPSQPGLGVEVDLAELGDPVATYG
ncbi:MAG: mandelate racemase/muconate lactonizing enzyme family protein [Actinomycetota bacterium]